MIKKLKNFFGLKKIPFSKSIASSELYQSQSLSCISSRLEFALENEDFYLITGAAGSGKSTALRFSLSQVDPLCFPYVYLTAENYKIGDIAKLFLSGLNIEPPFNAYKALNILKKSVGKMFTEKNQKPILIIDEAQELPLTTLVSIKNMANFNMDSSSMMLIILCGQYELLNKIKGASLESLKRRIRIHYTIEPLSIEECSKYIRHQMKLAGIDRKIFPDEIIAEIYRISKGNICNINNICFELLIQAAFNSKEIIEISLLDKIILPA
jgi:general secretion pathway protein A